ncbi:MAG: hypothetical protein DHS20C02_10250 [Micavibrio sp.]|nr:MAG: hypothetical protein DHS20C02_10250 [Micavibrio sp.]
MGQEKKKTFKLEASFGKRKPISGTKSRFVEAEGDSSTNPEREDKKSNTPRENPQP